jgi:hypothetical protein
MEKAEENITLESIYNASTTTPVIEWSSQHEKILIDWADKAICYKWLHEKSQHEFAKKSRWFTIPVIIMSTVTGTANFAQDKIPPEYLSVATMLIGAVNLIAGIITTIQQFLKINELNESHRVAAIAWDKFARNIRIELAKSPLERMECGHFLKHNRQEYDRLMETSPNIPAEIIGMFKTSFQNSDNYEDIIKPEICDVLVSTEKTKNSWHTPENMSLHIKEENEAVEELANKERLIKEANLKIVKD